MPDNVSLGTARANKKDEFYTPYDLIEAEMNAYVSYNKAVFQDKVVLLPCDDPEWSEFTRYFAANFERLGLKKLISTSYAKSAGTRQLTWFEESSPLYNPVKHANNGKLFVLEKDTNGDGIIDPKDIELTGYLEGDGDYRSDEVTALRDEADIIITNPPFSKFRDFLQWILEGQKLFSIIGNLNAVTYKTVFPYIRDNSLWLGASIHSGDRMFWVPEDYPLEAATCGVDENGRPFVRVKGVRWFTNLEHGRRHAPLQLDRMSNNLRYNQAFIKGLKKRFNKVEYPRYDNYDALEVSATAAIPSDYNGVMGVPISYIDHYCPEQFEIIGASESEGRGFSNGLWDNNSDVFQPLVNGQRLYKRLFIKRKAPQ